MQSRTSWTVRFQKITQNCREFSIMKPNSRALLTGIHLKRIALRRWSNRVAIESTFIDSIRLKCNFFSLSLSFSNDWMESKSLRPINRINVGWIGRWTPMSSRAGLKVTGLNSLLTRGQRKMFYHRFSNWKRRWGTDGFYGVCRCVSVCLSVCVCVCVSLKSLSITESLSKLLKLYQLLLTRRCVC